MLNRYEFNNTILILIIFILIFFNFLNSNLKLEKPDEDWSYFNIDKFHIEKRTVVEISNPHHELYLNIISSNNYYKINYYALTLYNEFLLLIKKRVNFDYNQLEDNINLDNKIKKKSTGKKFSFAKGNTLYEKENFSLFKHYNLIYFSNILFFLIVFIFTVTYYKKYNYNNLTPLLIFFLTPQINSHILFINSDFVILVLTPLIFILLINKRYLFLFTILILLHLLNRSALFLSISILFYISMLFFKFEKNYKMIISLYLFTIFVFLVCVYNFYLYDLFIKYDYNFIKKSSIYYLINQDFYFLLVTLIQSSIIFIISILYLDGQNSFIASYYDYIVFFLILLWMFIIINFKKNNNLSILYSFIYCAFIFIFFLDGFDQNRHHPLIYFSLIFIFFSNNMIKKLSNYILYKNLYIMFLIYINIKVLITQFY